MQVDSETVELSDNESHSGTLVWTDTDAGNYRVGVASDDDAEYSEREVVDAIVAITTLTGQGSGTFDWLRDRGVSFSPNNDTNITANQRLSYAIHSTLTNSGDDSTILSLKLFDSSNLSNTTDISYTDYIIRRVASDMENTSFISFESANKVFAEFDASDSPVFQPDITWGVRLKPNLSSGNTISALGSRYFTESSSMSGNSVMSSHNIRLKPTTASFSDTNSISLISDLQKYYSADLSAETTFSPDSVNLTLAAATWDNSILLEASEFVKRYVSLDFSSSPLISAPYTRVRTRSFTHEGTGSIEPVPILRRNRVEGQYRLTAEYPIEQAMEAIMGEEEMAAKILDR